MEPVSSPVNCKIWYLVKFIPLPTFFAGQPKVLHPNSYKLEAEVVEHDIAMFAQITLDDISVAHPFFWFLAFLAQNSPARIFFSET